MAMGNGGSDLSFLRVQVRFWPTASNADIPSFENYTGIPVRKCSGPPLARYGDRITPTATLAMGVLDGVLGRMAAGARAVPDDILLVLSSRIFDLLCRTCDASQALVYPPHVELVDDVRAKSRYAYRLHDFH